MATLLNGEEIKINVLVDTGAEACLMRQGLLPQHLLYPASEPLRFETANGEVLAGGNMCSKMRLLLNCESGELFGPEPFFFDVEFYEAKIKVDAILSFPWLAQAKLGIFPHHKALVLDSPGLTFLYGVRDHHKKHQPKIPSIFSVLGCKDCEISASDPLVAMPEKYGFSLPDEGFDQQRRYLEGAELQEVAAHLNTDYPPIGSINHMIVSREGDSKESAEVLGLRESFLSQYGGTVFRDSVYPDPPVRGEYGWASIPLKEGAIPTRAKPFFMHGERKEAL
jgi:hypothetical protein